MRLPGLPSEREVKPSTQVHEGARVQVSLPPTRRSALRPQDIPIAIIYQDRDLAVIDKPPFISMHPSAHEAEGTLVNSLLYHLKDLSGIGGEERPGIVHRLDRNTSGVLLVAKNDLAHQTLSTQFKNRTVRKTYLAILRGEWTAREGILHLPIGRSTYNRKQMMVRTDGQGREAVTAYSIIEEFDGYALAAIRPLTGRTHQIRVHMSKIRLPVAADSAYGRERRITISSLQGRPEQPGELPIIERQALHSSRIEFLHPRTGEPTAFEAPLPPDMRALLEALRSHRPSRR